MTICPNCDGRGYHIVDGPFLTGEPKGYPCETEWTCYNCDGTGEVKDAY